MIPNFDIKELNNITIGGVDSADYPDFCDAYIMFADYGDRELTEAECDWVTDQCADLVAELAFQCLL